MKRILTATEIARPGVVLRRRVALHILATFPGMIRSHKQVDK